MAIYKEAWAIDAVFLWRNRSLSKIRVYIEYFAISSSNFGDVTTHIYTIYVYSYVSIATLLSFPYLDNEMLHIRTCTYARMSVSACHLDMDIREYSRQDRFCHKYISHDVIYIHIAYDADGKEANNVAQRYLCPS